MKQSCLVSILLLVSFLLVAQGPLRPDIRFDNYTGRYGFPRQYMLDVVRDSAGYLWAFGNGLYRFSGTAITRYTNSNNEHHGLKDNYVAATQMDQQGRLWLGSTGLTWYDFANDRFHYIQPAGAAPYEYAYGQRIIGNTLWYATQYGLCKMDLRTLQPVTTSLHDGFHPWLIFDLDHDEVLYTTANGKYYIYNDQSGAFQTYNWQIDGEAIRIRCAVKTGHTIWLGTNKGVWKTGDLHALPAEQVKGLETLSVKAIILYPAMGGDSLIWLGTNGKGLTVVSSRTGHIVAQYKHDADNAFSLSADNINALYIDKDQKLWIAHENGISVLNPDNQLFKTQLLNFDRQDNGDNLVYRLYQDRYDPSAVWMSVGREGLVKLDWFTKKMTRQVPSIGSETSFYDICQVEQKLWLVNSYSRLFLWHEDKGLLKEIGFSHCLADPQPFNVRSIIRAGDRFYFPSNYGLYEYMPGQNTTRCVYQEPKHTPGQLKQFLENDMYYGYYDAVRQRVWVGSRTGLIEYDPETGRGWTRYDHSCPDTANSNALNMASPGPGGAIVCCTRNGISFYDPGKEKFTQVNRFGSVVNPGCASSITDGQKIWISSNAGIFSYDYATGTTDFVNYLAPQTEEFSLYQIGRIGNDITFGYRSAYSYFDLSGKRVRAVPSRPVIEKMLVNQQPYYAGGQAIELPYYRNAISFYFTAFEYNNPEAIRFRYRIAGQEESWVESQGERIAAYTRLPPGHYRFMVQSGSASGEWNGDAAIVEFIIRPPFWQTGWFRLLVALAIITAAFLWVRKRIRRIRKTEAEKTQANRMMAELEMRALRSQMNPHFIFNSLNSIQKYIWDNKQEDASEYLTKFSRLMRMILEHSMHKLITLEQELASLQLYMELEHRRCNNKFDYVIDVEDRLDLAQTLVPPMLMQPYIENAIWHGLQPKEGRGQLTITITRKGEYELQFEIADNGIGRKKARELQERKAKTAVSYGMQITSQRLHALEVNGHTGSVTIADLYEETDGDTGTKVTLTVPAEFFEKL